MKKLPPYGSTITSTDQTINIFAGFSKQVYPHVKHYYPDTVGIFLFDDPQNYRWPVNGREVIVFCWLYPNDEYLERLAYTLSLNGAEKIFIHSIPTHDQIIYTRS